MKHYTSYATFFKEVHALCAVLPQRSHRGCKPPTSSNYGIGPRSVSQLNRVCSSLSSPAPPVLSKSRSGTRHDEVQTQTHPSSLPSNGASQAITSFPSVCYGQETQSVRIAHRWKGGYCLGCSIRR